MPAQPDSGNLLQLFELIGELSRRRYQLAEREFAKLGLNHTEARALTLLDRAGGAATQDGLSKQIFLDRSATARALYRLEQDGLITRWQDATDRRTKHARITAEGDARAREIDGIRREMARRFFGNLDAAEAGAIVDQLRRAMATAEYHG